MNMVNERSKGSSVDESVVKAEGYQQNLNSFQFQAAHRSEGERSFMETEGRGFSDFYRNTSEDLFLKSLMESSAGVQMPTMEMLGFRNLSHNFRADSEELFKSWLTNGEGHGYNSSSIAHRTRLASRRMSTELTNLASQQHPDTLQNKKSNENSYPQNNSVADEISGDLSQHSVRPAAERGLQAGNFNLAKAWFQSSQPMTRSRSSELRKRYAAMQNVQTSTFGIEAMQNSGVNKLKQEFTNGSSNLSMCEMSNQFGTFMSPSNSSSSNFNTPQIEMGNLDNVSSVVNMLKGTLERKKMNDHLEKGIAEDSSNGLYHGQGAMVHNSFDQIQGNHIHGFPSFQEANTVLVEDPSILHTIEGFVNPTNPVQLRTASQEPSLSESSAAPVVSSGFDACDGPSNSTQTLSVCESSRKRVGNSRSPENGSRSREFRERIIDNLIDDRKRGSLTRNGSITSAGSVDKGDSTKKRRVERTRKMAEAKERGLTPPIPSDMQSLMKRCENFEKEVRSLKLNLSFMNRKDSEQTKQIEELQKQNEDLADEKERLLEEIERILSESGKI